MGEEEVFFFSFRVGFFLPLALCLVPPHRSKRKKEREASSSHLDERVALLVQICEDAVLVRDPAEAGALCRGGRGRGWARSGGGRGGRGSKGRRRRRGRRRARRRGTRCRCGAVVVLRFSGGAGVNWNRTSWRACSPSHDIYSCGKERWEARRGEEEERDREKEGKESFDRGDDQTTRRRQRERKRKCFPFPFSRSTDQRQFSLSFGHSDSRELLEREQALSLATKKRLPTKGSAEAAPQRRGPSERASKLLLERNQPKDKTASACARPVCASVPSFKAFASERRESRAPHQRKSNASTQSERASEAKKKEE